MLPLSGKSPEALRDLANQYLLWLDNQAAPDNDDGLSEKLLADMAWTAGVGRAHFPYRRGLVFRDSAELKAELQKLLDAIEETQGLEDSAATRTAFLFSGAGSPWIGMGETLYSTEPVFRAVLDRCDQLFREDRDVSLLDVMFGRQEDADLLQKPEWAFPAIYALEVALAALWESLGVKPAVTLGYGIGEIAASQTEGALPLEDGLRLAASWTALDAPPISSDALRQQGVAILIALGANADANSPLTEIATSYGNAAPQPVIIDSLLNPSDAAEEATQRFLKAVATAYEIGAPISFPGLFAGEKRRRISIPRYPFQRRSFWVQSRTSAKQAG